MMVGCARDDDDDDDDDDVDDYDYDYDHHHDQHNHHQSHCTYECIYDETPQSYSTRLHPHLGPGGQGLKLMVLAIFWIICTPISALLVSVTKIIQAILKCVACRRAAGDSVVCPKY